jgi:Na+-transporting NADH:ubiquinone oxidoreductase subunit A
MHRVKTRKGYRFHIEAGPAEQVESLADPSRLAFLPERIPFFIPRLNVAEGEAVSIGSPLCTDKRNPHIQFLSPAGGTISKIQFGPRRSIQAIVIDRDRRAEASIAFAPLDSAGLKRISRPELIERIISGGGWWVLRELPLRNLPAPETIPPLIIVALAADEPFQPSPAVYLEGSDDLLEYGLQVLKRLCDRLVVFCKEDDAATQVLCRPWLTHRVRGDYPAADPGTVLYHIKRTAAENHAWYIDGQDLLYLARLLSQGRSPTERIVAVGGRAAPLRRHVRTRIGAPLAHLSEPAAVQKDARWVVGGLMRGYGSSAEGYLGLLEKSLAILPEGGEAEFLALFRPGHDKPTYSRTFVSALNPGPLAYDCNLHGNHRACIACLHCAEICPVDILVHMTYKAILVEEVEEYLEHGLLDCVECGLCSFVCPSKIELAETLKAAKATYAKELGGPTE